MDRRLYDQTLRVALIHDWLTGMRGGEKALEVFCEMFPAADLFTLVHLPGTTSPLIERRRVKRSAIQWLPFAGRLYRAIPAAVPDRRRAIRSRRLRPGDQHEPLRRQVGGRDRPRAASLLLPDADALRVGPVRRVFRARSCRERLATALLRPVLAALARWDRATEGRVHRYLAISQYVARRIALYYNRQSTLVYPPVDTEFYAPASRFAGRAGHQPAARSFSWCQRSCRTSAWTSR